MEFGFVDSFNFVFDGLAPDCPVAIEHNANSSDPARKRLFRLGVERLIQVKRPSVLIVVGFPLGFNPGVPVVYYKSRIQKLREKNEKMGK